MFLCTAIIGSAVNHTGGPFPSFFPQFFAPGDGPTDFIVQDFAVVMIVAAIMMAITYRLKQPMVIGYILAGIVIGPFTPPFSLIREVGTLNVLAELGIIMLLFVIGTEFPIQRLKRMGKISFVVGITESTGTLLIVFFTAQALGFAFFDSLFLSLALSITSTVVTIKVLEDLGWIKSKSSTLVLGMLIVEDIFVVTALSVLRPRNRRRRWMSKRNAIRWRGLYN